MNLFSYRTGLLIENSNGINLYIPDYHDSITETSLLGIISIGDHSYHLFDFDYSSKYSIPYDVQIPKGYENLNIGEINLFLTRDSSVLREEELLNILSEYEHESSKKNPYSHRNGYVGGPSSNWDFEHKKKLENLENKFNSLDKRKGATDDEKKLIEIQQMYYNLFLEDYGLRQNDFVEEINMLFDLKKGNNKIHKKFIKTYPNLLVRTNIKHL